MMNAQPPAGSPVMSVAELLAVLPISRATLNRHFRSGRLPVRKLGRRTLVLRSDFDAFVAGLPTSNVTGDRGEG